MAASKGRALLTAALGCAAWLAAGAPAGAFSAKFSWRGIAACGAVSPAFALKSVPRGTAALAMTMRDRDVPDAAQSGATVPYAGRGAVPKGAVSYAGPCPPKGARHHYIWTIHALDQHGADLDMTEAAGDFRN